MLMQAGRAQEAVMLYNEILSRNASAQVYCEAIAELAIYYMRERDFYEAFAYLRRTQLMRVRSKPTDQLLKLAEGVTFLMKKKYAEAILLVGAAQLQFAHSLAGHSPFLLNLHANALAFAHFSLGNHQAALALYRQIVRDDPSTDFTASNYNIAICEGILHYQGAKR
jgi:tetratricopeptide (TPR) repeat protein